MRLRFSALVGGLLLAAPLVSHASPLPFAFSISLATGVGQQGNDINNNGQFTGVWENTGGTFYGDIYGNTVPGNTLGGNATWGEGINDNGMVAGFSYTADNTPHAIRWDSNTGTLSDLGTLSGQAASKSYGHDINNNGQIVGYSGTGTFVSDPFFGSSEVMHGFITTVSGLQDLGTLGGSYSQANAINNLGQVTGSSNLNDDPFSYSGRAFIWENGVMSALGTLGGNTYGNDINDNGLVTGYSYTGTAITPGENHAFIGDTATGLRDLGTLGGGISIGYGLNNQDMVVGKSRRADGSNGAFLWVDGFGMLDLEALIADMGDWAFLDTAYAINDNGYITGMGRLNGVGWRGFVLTPIDPASLAQAEAPLPAPVVLLAIGLTALGWQRRRPA